jgi:SnoaL-like domain
MLSNSNLHLALSVRRMCSHAERGGSKMECNMEMWELDARESIRDLVSRYNSNGDSGRFDEVRKLFRDDSNMIVEGKPHNGIDEVMTIFTGTQGTLHASGQQPIIRHFTSTHQIDLIDSENAKGRLYFFVTTAIGPDHWGVYMDTYRKGAEGRWQFASRRVKVEGRAENSIFKAV